MKLLNMRIKQAPDARHKFVSALLVRMRAQLRLLLEIRLEPVLYALDKAFLVPAHAMLHNFVNFRFMPDPVLPQARFDSPGAQASAAPLDICLTLVLYAIDKHFLVPVHA